MSDNEHSDRRNAARRPVMLVVEYDGADDLVADFTENISTGGTFVHTRREFAIGASVRLILSFPGLLQPVTMDGNVQWVRREADGEPGIGIQFGNYTEPVREKLQAVIDRIATRDPLFVGRVVRILIVEDNPHVARLIRDGLDQAFSKDSGGVSLDFRHAQNGRQALATLKTEPFDALITDVYLPEMDGISLITNIRTSDAQRSLPIIAVSAGGPSAGKAALEAGADFFIEKPMRLRHVVETLKQLVTLEQAL